MISARSKIAGNTRLRKNKRRCPTQHQHRFRLSSAQASKSMRPVTFEQLGRARSRTRPGRRPRTHGRSPANTVQQRKRRKRAPGRWQVGPRASRPLDTTAIRSCEALNELRRAFGYAYRPKNKRTPRRSCRGQKRGGERVAALSLAGAGRAWRGIFLPRSSAAPRSHQPAPVPALAGCCPHAMDSAVHSYLYAWLGGGLVRLAGC